MKTTIGLPTTSSKSEAQATKEETCPRRSTTQRHPLVGRRVQLPRNR